VKELLILFLLAGVPMESTENPNREKLTAEFIMTWRVNQAGLVEVFFKDDSIGVYTVMSSGPCPTYTEEGITALSYVDDKKDRCYMINEIPVTEIKPVEKQ
jgi:hypothetical protein